MLVMWILPAHTSQAWNSAAQTYRSSRLRATTSMSCSPVSCGQQPCLSPERASPLWVVSCYGIRRGGPCHVGLADERQGRLPAETRMAGLCKAEGTLPDAGQTASWLTASLLQLSPCHVRAIRLCTVAGVEEQHLSHQPERLLSPPGTMASMAFTSYSEAPGSLAGL